MAQGTQKQDPLAQAMGLYQMFAQPKQDKSLDLILGLLQSQETNALRERQLAQDEAYNRERLDLTRSQQELYKQGLNIKEEKEELSPADLQMAIRTYSNPKATPEDRLTYGDVLARKAPRLKAQIDSDMAAKNEDLGLTGGPVKTGGAAPQGGSKFKELYGQTIGRLPTLFDLPGALRGMWNNPEVPQLDRIEPDVWQDVTRPVAPTSSGMEAPVQAPINPTIPYTPRSLPEVPPPGSSAVGQGAAFQHRIPQATDFPGGSVTEDLIRMFLAPDPNLTRSRYPYPVGRGVPPPVGGLTIDDLLLQNQTRPLGAQ